MSLGPTTRCRSSYGSTTPRGLGRRFPLLAGGWGRPARLRPGGLFWRFGGSALWFTWTSGCVQTGNETATDADLVSGRFQQFQQVQPQPLPSHGRGFPLCRLASGHVSWSSWTTRAASSAAERSLHTGKVTGSIPVPPTITLRRRRTRPRREAMIWELYI